MATTPAGTPLSTVDETSPDDTKATKDDVDTQVQQVLLETIDVVDIFEVADAEARIASGTAGLAPAASSGGPQSLYRIASHGVTVDTRRPPPRGAASSIATPNSNVNTPLPSAGDRTGTHSRKAMSMDLGGLQRQGADMDLPADWLHQQQHVELNEQRVCQWFLTRDRPKRRAPAPPRVKSRSMDVVRQPVSPVQEVSSPENLSRSSSVSSATSAHGATKNLRSFTDPTQPLERKAPSTSTVTGSNTGTSSSTASSSSSTSSSSPSSVSPSSSTLSLPASAVGGGVGGGTVRSSPAVSDASTDFEELVTLEQLFDDFGGGRERAGYPVDPSASPQRSYRSSSPAVPRDLDVPSPTKARSRSTELVSITVDNSDELLAGKEFRKRGSTVSINLSESSPIAVTEDPLSMDDPNLDDILRMRSSTRHWHPLTVPLDSVSELPTTASGPSISTSSNTGMRPRLASSHVSHNWKYDIQRRRRDTTTSVASGTSSGGLHSPSSNSTASATSSLGAGRVAPPPSPMPMSPPRAQHLPTMNPLPLSSTPSTASSSSSSSSSALPSSLSASSSSSQVTVIVDSEQDISLRAEFSPEVSKAVQSASQRAAECVSPLDGLGGGRGSGAGGGHKDSAGTSGGARSKPLPAHMKKDCRTVAELLAELVSGQFKKTFFRDAFLLTMPYFITPDRVLDALLEHLMVSPLRGIYGDEVPEPPHPEETLFRTKEFIGSSAPITSPKHLREVHREFKKGQIPTDKGACWRAGILRAFSVLKYWVNTYPQDFDPSMELRLMQTLMAYPPLHWLEEINAYNLEVDQKSLRSVATLLITTYQKAKKRQLSVPSYRVHLPFSTAGSLPLAQTFLMWRELLALPAATIAGQLNCITRTRLLHIDAREFLMKGCTRDDNVNQMKLSNQCSLWVASEIVSCETESDRIAMLTKFIDVAAVCLDKCNFNSVFEIMCGLNHHTVYRLRHEFSKLSNDRTKKLKSLNDLTDAAQNYAHYRRALLDASHSTQKVRMPYLGVVLKDLVALEDGTPRIRLDSSTVVWTKCMKVARLVYDTLSATKGKASDKDDVGLSLRMQLAMMYALNPEQLLARSRTIKPVAHQRGRRQLPTSIPDDVSCVRDNGSTGDTT